MSQSSIRRGFAAHATAGAIQVRPRLGSRWLATALLSSLCLTVSFAAAAQASPQQHNVAPAHELTVSPLAKLGTLQSDASAPKVLNRDATMAVRCGYYTVDVTLAPDVAVYWHCGPAPICIRVDDRFRPDRREEVGPWEHKRLGNTSGVRGAWHIGEPHPTLRCRI